MTRARLSNLAAALLLSALLVVSLGATAFADDTPANSANATAAGNTQANNTTQNSNEGSNESTVELDPEKNAIKENQVPDSSFIYDTPLADLASADVYYDGTTVQVVGEAVGDVVNEDSPGSNYKWVALWDNSSTIVVYMAESDADLIDTLGSSHRKGTKLQVRGVFHLTCDEHGGISDLHAENVTVLEKGQDIKTPFRFEEFIPGIIALLIGFGLLVLFRRLRDRNV